MVPRENGQAGYGLLVTARHIVDPVWVGCSSTNPTRLFVRVNKVAYDPKVDKTGVAYIPIDLTKDGTATWVKSDNEDVDVAVFRAPPALLSGHLRWNF